MAQLNEFEICQDYRQSKNKNQQIKILAELNACKPQTIIEILTKNGEITGLSSTQKPRRIDWAVLDKEVEKLAGEGYKVSDIAEKLGISTQDIYNRRSYFNKKAKSEFEKAAGIKTKPPKEKPKQAVVEIEPAPAQKKESKLEIAISALREASQKINDAGIDFSISYDIYNDSFSVSGSLFN